MQGRKDFKMEETKKMSGNRVITGERTRWSYCNALQPREDDNGKMKYSVSLIIPKDDTETVEAIKQAIKYAYNDGTETLAGKNGVVPEFDEITTPLNDGDEERPNDDVYKNSYYINAKSDYAPNIIDRHGRKLKSDEDVYSGCYGRVSITFYAYRKNKNVGIGAGLNNMLKCADGERLGGTISAETDFADFIDVKNSGSDFFND